MCWLLHFGYFTCCNDKIYVIAHVHRFVILRFTFCDPRQGVDYEDDGCTHDLLSDLGFLFAIRQILRLKEGALLYWALPCNSFSFMARSLHQRTMSEPFGQYVHKFVMAGNILATRVACLTMLALCRRVRFMIEQPDRSLAAVFPYFMHIFSFKNVEILRVFWWDPQFLKQMTYLWNLHLTC